MSRLADIREQDATGKAADIFAGIKKAMGKVPNAYLTIGGHSPAALQQALAQAGIRLFGGVSGDADAAVHALLAGNLGYNPNVRCDHHDHEHGEGGHTCGDHGCGHHGCH